MIRSHFIQTFLLLAILLFNSRASQAQNDGIEKDTAQVQQTESELTPENASTETSKIISLRRVLQSINQIETNISNLQKELGSPQSKGIEQKLELQIRENSSELAALKRSFEEIASGVEIEAFYPNGGTDELSFSNELKDLLSPLINELKRATSRTRELDRLRTDLSTSSELIAVTNDALLNLEKLKQKIGEKPELLQEVERATARWLERKRKLEAEVSIAEQKLAQRLDEKKSLAESAQEVFQLFFKSRGRNLLVALFLAILFSVCVRKIQAAIHSSRFVNRKDRKFNVRLLNFVFFLLSGIGGLIVFLLVLFAFGDWVLLILGFLLVFGLVWTSKEALPKFWSQAAMLLNIGPVREGERVVYQGVPFRVKSLNYYSVLENPLLDGAPLRLPISDLAELRSRESRKSEPWFPTERGDWVVLGDSKVGQVEIQTAQFVRVALLGGAKRNYFSEEFISQHFTVISQGFRIKSIFGFDYRHQSIVTDEIPTKLKSDILNVLEERGYPAEDYRLKVEFYEAGASSLDVAIIGDFPGKWAKDYEVLQRLIPRITVDSCNKEHWVIPFTQITVHQADH